MQYAPSRRTDDHALPRAPLTLVLLALALTAVTPPAGAQGAQSDSAAILDAGRQFSAADMRGNVDALTALAPADAVIFPERSDAITGLDAIRRYWTPGNAGRITRHRLTPTRVALDGHHAYDPGERWESMGSVHGEIPGRLAA